YMHYGVIDRDNRLVHYVPVELPGPRWPHDMGITPNYTILHDTSMFFDPEALKQGVRRAAFHRDVPTRFGVIPRRGDPDSIRWFEATPCHIMHLANCYEDGDEIVMDGCIMPEPKVHPVGSAKSKDIYARILAKLDKHQNHTLMHRWRFNLRTGRTTEQYLDDEITEFPICSNDYVGRPYRYSYNVLYKPGDWLFSGLKRFDVVAGSTQRLEFGEGRYGSEPHVARRTGATREDDGYLITLVADVNADRSEVLVLDASDISRPPLATIILPERIAIGTHACWVEGDRIHGEHRDPAALAG
ncbi:MAG: carotenoid oxygenase family protein, partial [Burkholderiaceae bacterium]